MKKKTEEKTSLFRGISFRRGKWCAQFSKTKFYREFDDEMEALAHFMAVFSMPGINDRKSVESMIIFNTPDKGRKSLEEYRQILDDMSHQFAVDKKHIVRLNEISYIGYQSLYWFVKFERVVGICGCRKIDQAPWFEFDYCYLDEIIYKNKSEAKGEPYKLVGANILKLNGNPFDLRFCNLARPATGGVAKHTGFSPLAPIKRQRPSLEELYKEEEKVCGEDGDGI